MDKGYFKSLKIKKIEIDTGELIAVLNDFDAKELSVVAGERVVIKNSKGDHLTLVLDTSETYVKRGQIGLYEDVYFAIDLEGEKEILVNRARKPLSVKYIKSKMRGDVLSFEQISSIVEDIKYNRLSKIELTGFMSGVFINGMNTDESYAMAKNIMASGSTLDLGVKDIVVDKHSIGGINGRATMLTVPIVAVAGLYIPKTSSRAITSAGGTADSMEVLTNVEHSVEDFKEIVLKAKGGIIWGGGVSLAPVDDKIISVEFPLSLDPRGQVVASVLAKKASVGANKVIIDLPVGPELKVKTIKEAESLAGEFVIVGKKLGIHVRALITNGSIPSGPVFGPALEARHAMRILEGEVYDNLAQKACELAGKLIEMGGVAPRGEGVKLAQKILKSGKALEKMKEIINLQGKRIDNSKDIPFGEYRETIHAKTQGYIHNISIKELTEIAKYAGAPFDKYAGVMLEVEPNDSVKSGDAIYTIYAQNKQKLESAIEYAKKNNPVRLEGVILSEI